MTKTFISRAEHVIAAFITRALSNIRNDQAFNCSIDPHDQKKLLDEIRAYNPLLQGFSVKLASQLEKLFAKVEQIADDSTKLVTRFGSKATDLVECNVPRVNALLDELKNLTETSTDRLSQELNRSRQEEEFLKKAIENLKLEATDSGPVDCNVPDVDDVLEKLTILTVNSTERLMDEFNRSRQEGGSIKTLIENLSLKVSTIGSLECSPCPTRSPGTAVSSDLPTVLPLNAGTQGK